MKNKCAYRVTDIDKTEKGKFSMGIRFTDKESVTNGHWLILKKHVPANILKRVKVNLIKQIEPEELWRNLGLNNEVTEVKTCEFYDEDLDSYSNYVEFNFKDSSKLPVFFQEKYIRFFEYWIENFNLLAYDNKKPAFMYSGNTLIGLLMPFRP